MERLIKVDDSAIKFNRVESRWEEVYRKRTKETYGLDPAELKNMLRVDKDLTVKIDLDLPDGKWQRKVEYFVHFNKRVYRVTGVNPDDAVVALVKLGFIGTQRLINKPNNLYEDVLSNKAFIYRVQNIDNAQIIVHCYDDNSTSPTRLQYIIKDSNGTLLTLADQIGTHYIAREMAY
jgi:hypothetical protein